MRLVIKRALYELNMHTFSINNGYNVNVLKNWEALNMMHGMHGMYGYGSIWMIVFWVILIGFGIYLVKRFINGDKNSVNKNKKNTPLQTLQERLARGEIDVEEYEHLKSIIKRDKD